MLLASFPSPDRSVWDLGPVPIRAYALCIIAGIIFAIWLGERRWIARGGKQGTVSDIAVWAVIFGLVGGRLYHVITDNELYFRAGRDPWRAFYVWEGGLGIWGAVALGGLGAWIACRRRGIRLPPFADAVAPGIAAAQGIGRLGNYFNQELFGRPTDLPWAVEIDPDRPSTVAGATTYHPTFLYELIWDLGLAGVLIWADRRWTMGRGRVFALYVMGYTLGRVWIEALRIDSANKILGLRLNIWTSILVFAGGLAYFLLHRGPRETEVEPTTHPATPTATTTDADPAADGTAAAAPDAADADTADADATKADATKADATDAADAAAKPTAKTATATADDPEAAPATTAADADAKPTAATADAPTTLDAAEGDEKPTAATVGDPATAGGATAATTADAGDGPAATATAATAEDAGVEPVVAGAPATGGEPGPVGGTGTGGDGVGEDGLTAEERVAAGEATTAEPMTVERRRRLLPAGRRKK